MVINVFYISLFYLYINDNLLKIKQKYYIYVYNFLSGLAEVVIYFYFYLFESKEVHPNLPLSNEGETKKSSKLLSLHLSHPLSTHFKTIENFVQ